jgi:WD40 repeat protein
MSQRNRSRSLAGWLLACAACGIGGGCKADAPAFAEIHSWKLPDGKAAVLGSGLGDAVLVRAPWQDITSLQPTAGGVLDVRFLEGDRVMLVSENGVIEIRRASDGTSISQDKPVLDGDARRALATRDGRYVAFDARVYDVQAKRWVVEQHLPAEQTGLDFAAGKYVLIAGYHDKSIDLKSLDGAEVHQWHTEGKTAAAAMSGEARYVAAATDDHVMIWSSATGAPPCEKSADEKTSFLRFGDGWLAAAETKLRVWNIPQCEEIASLSLAARATALDVDGDLIAVGDYDGEVYVWDVRAGRLIGQGRATARYVRALKVNAASRSVFVAGDAVAGYEVKLLRLTDKSR